MMLLNSKRHRLNHNYKSTRTFSCRTQHKHWKLCGNKYRLSTWTMVSYIFGSISNQPLFMRKAAKKYLFASQGSCDCENEMCHNNIVGQAIMCWCYQIIKEKKECHNWCITWNTCKLYNSIKHKYNKCGEKFGCTFSFCNMLANESYVMVICK